jgi:hypothetical protein
MVLRVMAVLRIAFAALAGYTLVFAAQRAVTAPNGIGIVDFFSYFTILSNIAATVVLAVGGVALLFGLRGVPDAVRGAVVAYMAVTGLVYAVVLQAAQEGQLVPWIDDVVHRLLPAFVLVDWLVVPPRRRVTYAAVPYWLVFPGAFVAYSLTRGAIVHWYPYPFLDPRVDGYLHVAAESFIVALAIAVICLAVVWLGALARRAAPDSYRAL